MKKMTVLDLKKQISLKFNWQEGKNDPPTCVKAPDIPSKDAFIKLQRRVAVVSLTRQHENKMGKMYPLQVYGIEGNMIPINLCKTEEEMKKMTVLDLKKQISLKFNWQEDRMRLNFTTIKLEGDSTLLSSYGIQKKSVIHIVGLLPGGQTTLTA